MVQTRDIRGKWHACRVLVDSGSQPNFITRDLSNKLGFAQNKTNISIAGVGESGTKALYLTKAHIRSLNDN